MTPPQPTTHSAIIQQSPDKGVQTTQIKEAGETKPIAEQSPSAAQTIPNKQLPILQIDQKEVVAYAQNLENTMFGESEWASLVLLLGKESGWQIGRVNESSYACGIGQSLPCSKMYGYMPETEWRQTDYGQKLFIKNPDYKLEINWTLNYIKQRYGTPTAAYAHWQAEGWY